MKRKALGVSLKYIEGVVVRWLKMFLHCVVSHEHVWTSVKVLIYPFFIGFLPASCTKSELLHSRAMAKCIVEDLGGFKLGRVVNKLNELSREAVEISFEWDFNAKQNKG